MLTEAYVTLGTRVARQRLALSAYRLAAVIEAQLGRRRNANHEARNAFVLLGIWADQRPAASRADARRAFVVLLLCTAVGLVA